MGAFRATYDKDADVLYVLMSDEPAHHSECIDDVRNIDYSEDGRLLGVEFVNPSSGIDLEGLPFADKIEKLIERSGYKFRVLNRS